MVNTDGLNNEQILHHIYQMMKDSAAANKQSMFDALNYKVKDVFNNEHSIFDLVRYAGGQGYPVPWYGFDGQRPTEGRTTTSAAVADGYSDALLSGLRRDVAELRAIVSALALSTGAVIDLGEIARVVNDEADERDRERLGVDLPVLEQAPAEAVLPPKEG